MTVEERIQEARDARWRAVSATEPGAFAQAVLASLHALTDAVEAIATDTEGAHRRLDLHERRPHP